MLPYSEWLDSAMMLPEGRTTRKNHICGTGRTLLLSHDSRGYSAHCFRCSLGGFKPHGVRTLDQLAAAKEARTYERHNQTGHISLPGDYTTEVPTAGRMWYWRAGIDDSIARLYGFGWSPAQRRVVLPVRDARTGALLAVQGRAVDAGVKPKYLNVKASSRGGVGFFTDARTIGHYKRPGERLAIEEATHPSGSRIVICEDILSAVRVGMSTQAGCLLGTKLDAGLAARLSAWERVTFWLDGDRAGINGRVQAMRTLALLHAGEIDYIKTEDDPKCYSQEEIEEWLI